MLVTPGTFAVITLQFTSNRASRSPKCFRYYFIRTSSFVNFSIILSPSLEMCLYGISIFCFVRKRYFHISSCLAQPFTACVAIHCCICLELNFLFEKFLSEDYYVTYVGEVIFKKSLGRFRWICG